MTAYDDQVALTRSVLIEGVGLPKSPRCLEFEVQGLMDDPALPASLVYALHQYMQKGMNKAAEIHGKGLPLHRDIGGHRPQTASSPYSSALL